MPLGCEQDSHRPDKVNFSHPRVRTRSSVASTSTPAGGAIEDGISFCASMDDMETMPSEEHEDRSQNHHPVQVIGTQETDCDEREWHISRLPKSSAKACFAQQAVTKKKCTARIVQNNVAITTPTYTSLMVNYKKNRNDVMQFFFCNDDIERCVKGTKRKWVISVPKIPTTWPMKRGTNLSKQEILALEAAGSNFFNGSPFCPGDYLANIVGYTCYHPIQSPTMQMSIPRFEVVRELVGIPKPRQRCKHITLHLH